VFSQYKAEDTIKRRDELTAAVFERLLASVKGPIVVESIQLENIDLSPEFMANIEDKANQTLKVETMKQLEQQAIVQARTTVVQAQAAADSNLAATTATAKGIEITGLAEASAINARGTALRNNPDVVALVQAEKWDGKLPTTMVPNSTVPFLDVNNGK
jgi:regulator of protease activity HflC (stomatin/prohibitin superfamily)